MTKLKEIEAHFSIAFLMQRFRLSNTEVAEAIGVSANSVSAIKRGVSKVNVNTFVRLMIFFSEEYGISPSEFMRRTFKFHSSLDRVGLFLSLFK